VTTFFVRRFSRPATAAAALALALAGCGSAAAGTVTPGDGPGPVAGTAAGPGPDSIAAQLEQSTLPAGARQAQFAWDLDEAGAKFRGRGVARYHAPDRFRLDLFGPRGETLPGRRAGGETPRIPPAVAGRFKLPPPALLWAAVGVVRPPGEAQLQSAAADGEQAVVRYSIGEEGVLEYRARGGGSFPCAACWTSGVRESRGAGARGRRHPAPRAVP
jgi:hypothetical protein